MGDKKPMVIPGKGRVLTVAELGELARRDGPLSRAAKVAQEARDAQEDAEHKAREAAELAQFTSWRTPAHVDPRPTIAPGKMRPCEDCGELCDPTIFGGLCDGCADDADAGCEGPEESIGADPEPDDE